jgi:MFS family permease
MVKSVNRPFLSIVLPTALISAASIAVVPAVIGVALSAGASPAEAGTVVTAASVGSALLSVPGSVLVSKLTARISLPLSAAVVAIALAAMVISTDLRWLGLCMFVAGASAGIHAISRVTLVAEDSTGPARDVLFAHLGIYLRVSLVAGPLIGGAVIFITGSPSSSFLAAGILAAAAAVLHAVSARGSKGNSTAPAGWTNPLKTLRSNRGPILRAAGMSSIFAASAKLKIVLLPLFCYGFGLTVAQTSVVVAVSAGFGIIGAIAGKQVTHHHGSVFAGMVSMVVVTVAVTGMGLSPAVWLLIAASCVADFGGGIGSGFVSTVFAKASEKGDRALTIAVLNAVYEAAAFAVPAAVLALVSVAALPVAAGTGSVIAGVAAVILWSQRRDARARTTSSSSTHGVL